MTLDILHFIDNKGGNAEEIRESQRKRGHSVELVDEIIAMYAEWVKMDFDANNLSKQVNAVQKEISAKKKGCFTDICLAKEPADDLVAKKKDLDAQVEAKRKEAKDFEAEMRKKASTVGNIVGKNVPVSLTEDENAILRTWHPKDEADEPPVREGIMPHHEVLLRLDAMDLDRGAKIAGHRGYYLTNDGIDLNQALISYGLDFLRKKGYKKIQPPFMMNKDWMGKTAQLDQFDEELYKVIASEDEKYLIATSEQPISAFHADEWLEKSQLPIKYAGYSTCFRKEAGSAGRDMWGIFRVHQFEKVEQFIVDDPEKSWETLESMIVNSEEFYQSLGLRYQVVGIVSGALNLAAAMKYDLEAWFPFQKAHKELVSCSNCTDYRESHVLVSLFSVLKLMMGVTEARRLEVRCGLKTKDQARKVYCHMLNGTLCATERALCCLVENYQTPDGVRIPEVLRPYMQGRDFLPWVKELPKSLQRKQA
ncbi:Cytosolic seryl-tRNA synthetase [Paramarasmius palmivorus]|uniref:serine--tRNA ligase n=1 Tax=Paramarasmius palmivorus TaxID=297713 RepID=A0AAW0DL67_9AGAR